MFRGLLSFVALCAVINFSVYAVDSRDDYWAQKLRYCTAETHSSSPNNPYENQVVSLYENEYKNGKLLSSRFYDLQVNPQFSFRQVVSYDEGEQMKNFANWTNGKLTQKHSCLTDGKQPEVSRREITKFYGDNGQISDAIEKEIQTIYNSENHPVEQSITIHKAGQLDQTFNNQITYDNTGRVASHSFCESENQYGNYYTAETDEAGQLLSSACYKDNQILERKTISYYSPNITKEYKVEFFKDGQLERMTYWRFTPYQDLEEAQSFDSGKSMRSEWENFYEFDSENRIISHTQKTISSTEDPTDETEMQEKFTYEGNRLVQKVETRTPFRDYPLIYTTNFDYSCTE